MVQHKVCEGTLEEKKSQNIIRGGIQPPEKWRGRRYMTNDEEEREQKIHQEGETEAKLKRNTKKYTHTSRQQTLGKRVGREQDDTEDIGKRGQPGRDASHAGDGKDEGLPDGV